MAKRVRKPIKPKFDWGGFKLIGGMGISMAAFGSFLFWVSYTVPEGVKGSDKISLSHRIVGLIPQETQAKIAMGISALFILFGTFLILTTIYRTLKFIITKRN
ncbi:MAG: hypothetical protein RBT74_13700 [Tenuifilaceae bacterium]|jgi:hypothetical protein|nr:hypothetical protein [Tenuifilaceae bacterium]